MGMPVVTDKSTAHALFGVVGGIPALGILICCIQSAIKSRLKANKLASSDRQNATALGNQSSSMKQMEEPFTVEDMHGRQSSMLDSIFLEAGVPLACGSNYATRHY
jgi:hypothetical protein